MADERSGRKSCRLCWGAIAAVVLVGTYVLGGTWYGGDLAVHATWPGEPNWATSTTVPVSVTDARGRPVSGVDVAIGRVALEQRDAASVGAAVVDDQWKRLATETTGSAGRVWLELPSAEEWFGETGERPESATVVVRATDGWQSALEGRPFSRPERARLALTADRRAFEPGETIRLRGVVFKPDGSGPIEGANRGNGPEAVLSVEEPGGNVIYRRRTAPSNAGLVVGEVELAEDGRVGDYRARLEYRGTQTSQTLQVRPATESTLDGSVSDDRAGGEPSRDAEMTVEVFPANAPHFRIGDDHRAVVMVRDAEGAPVEGATVTWERGASSEVATTDEAGEVQLDWTPEASHTVLADGGADPVTTGPIDRRIDVPLRVSIDQEAKELVASAVVVGGETILVTPETASPEAGTRLAFSLDLPDGFEKRRTELPVVAMHQGNVVARTSLPTDDESPSGEIDLSERIRGLVQLVALSTTGRPVGRAPVWVRQSGGSEMRIAAGEGAVRSGEVATASVEAPFASEEGERGETTFGIWAVDGASHRRSRRLGLAYPAMLWHRTEASKSVARAADVMEASEGASGDGESHLAARLARATAGADTGADREPEPLALNRTAAQSIRRGWGEAWSVFLYVLLVVLAAGLVRLTRRYDTAEAISWRSVGLFVGALSGGVACHAAILSGIRWMGGFEPLRWVVPAAAGVCLALGLVQAQFRGPESGFRRWIGLVVAQAALLASVVWVGAAAGTAPLEILGLVPITIAWIAMLIVVSAFWAAAMFERRLSWAFLGAVAAVVGASIAPTLVLWSAPSATGADGVDPEPPGAEQIHARHAPGTARHAPGTDREGAENAREDGDSAASTGGMRRRGASGATALWRPAVTENGARDAEVEFTVPDPGMHWHLGAVAHDTNGRLADGAVPLAVEQSFTIDLDLPETLRSGDRPNVPVRVVDRRSDPDSPLDVHLVAAGQGSLEVWERSATARVPAGGQKVVGFPLVVGGVGEGTMTIRAESGGGMDAGEIRAQDGTDVVTDGRLEVRRQAGWIAEGWGATFDVPLSAYPGSLSASVEVLSGTVPVALEAAKALGRGRRGDLDRVVSAVRANDLAVRALDEIGRADWPGGTEEWRRLYDRGERQLRRGYQTLLRYQQPSGGFAAYPGENRAPEVGATAYGLLQLAAIDRSVDSIDASRSVDTATRWLVDARYDDYATTALAVWALARSPSSDESVQGTIERGRDMLVDQDHQDRAAAYGRALAASALVEAGEREAASELLQAIREDRSSTGAEASTDGAGEPAAGVSTSGGAVATTALATRAGARLGKEADSSESAVRVLAGQWDHRDGWGSPRVTVWALEALAHMDVWTAGEPNVVEALLDGNPMQGSDGDGAARVFPGRSARKTFEARRFFPGARRFEVEPKVGEMPAIARATVRYTVPWRTAGGGAGRVPVILALEGANWEGAVGEKIEMNATVTNDSEESFRRAIVSLPVAPGGGVDASELRSAGDELGVTYLERTPTHLIAYVSSIEPGESRSLEYAIRPRLAGRYRLPPIRVAVPGDPRAPAVEEGGQLRIETTNAE